MCESFRVIYIYILHVYVFRTVVVKLVFCSCIYIFFVDSLGSPDLKRWEPKLSRSPKKRSVMQV